MLDFARKVSRRPLLAGTALVMFAVATVAGAATTYSPDPAKSTVTFIGKQDNEPFEGKFTKFQASIVFSPGDLAHGRFDVTVDTRSVDTGDDDRDGAVKNEDLLFAQKYPSAHFVSSGFTSKGAGQFEATGKLTIRGVTHDIRFPFTWTDAKGSQPASLQGQLALKRLDYGIGQGDWKDTSVASNDVTVKFALALKASSSAPAASNNPDASPAETSAAGATPAPASKPATAPEQKTSTGDPQKRPCPKKAAQVKT